MPYKTHPDEPPTRAVPVWVRARVPKEHTGRALATPRLSRRLRWRRSAPYPSPPRQSKGKSRMKRLLVIAALMVVGTPPVFAQEQGTLRAASTATSGTVEQALMRLEQELTDASIKGDAPAVERHLADTYTSTDPGGNVTDRAGEIANLKSGALKLETAHNDEMSATLTLMSSTSTPRRNPTSCASRRQSAPTRVSRRALMISATRQ
jgi:hypothetical protein